jgi:hypothetical protein
MARTAIADDLSVPPSLQSHRSAVAYGDIAAYCARGAAGRPWFCARPHWLVIYATRAKRKADEGTPVDPSSVSRPGDRTCCAASYHSPATTGELAVTATTRRRAVHIPQPTLFDHDRVPVDERCTTAVSAVWQRELRYSPPCCHIAIF